MVLPVLLYGCESWAPLSHHVQWLQKFVTRCWRIIYNIFFWQKLRNTEIRKIANIERVETMIQLRRLRWLGHVERMPENRLPKISLVSKMADGKRSQGGQKQRWHDVINSDLKSLNLTSNWRTKANDRKNGEELDRLLKNLNQTKEQIEKNKKDCKKNNDNSGNTTLTCNYNNCNKVCLSKAGLANHIRQSHSEKSSDNRMLFLSQRLQTTSSITKKKFEKERKNLTFLSATT